MIKRQVDQILSHESLTDFPVPDCPVDTVVPSPVSQCQSSVVPVSQTQNESLQVSGSVVGDASVAVANDVMEYASVSSQIVDRDSVDHIAVSGTRRYPVRSTRGQLPSRYR